MNQDRFTLITGDKYWMEQTALDQLRAVSALPGMVQTVGLPDLHAGTTPVGVAAVTEGIIYPHLIGNDIGCGMGLFATGIPVRKYKQDKFVMRLNYIRALEDLPTENPFPEESPIYDLGTIGSGNHFAEFQRVEEILDPAAFETLDFPKDEIQLLVHSGSRAYGQRILSRYNAPAGYAAGSDEAKAYFAAHDDALLWARRNRALVAEKIVDWLGFSNSGVAPIIDIPHNFLEQQDGLYYHRKGAAPAARGIVVIPGSRGSLTYLAKPVGDIEKAARSLSHGAGRKWAHSLCKSRIRDKYDRDTIRSTALRSRVVCHDTDLLFQEAPEAYKNIEQVIGALLLHGLIEVVATLRPLITYKG